MKRYFLFAVGFAIFGLSILTQPVKSQVYTDFDVITRVQNTYTEITAPNVLFAGDFGLPPSFSPVNKRNGYYKRAIALPWKFEFNGDVFEDIWININGFCTFQDAGAFPPFVAPDVPEALFTQTVSYPNNVMAPFWGDHYYRDADDRFNGFLESQISWGVEMDNGNEVFIVQWKNLNINFEDSEGNPIKSSVGNFQLRLFKSTTPDNYQGDIQFCYGQVGGNPDPDAGNIVVTRNATVGIKGSTLIGDYADFVNGLYYDEDPIDQRTQRTLTNEWTPSGGTDWRIHFGSRIVPDDDEWWGDGDTDISKGVSRKHFGMPQNRFVTVEDVRLIMRSMATNVPLDSVRSRSAFHGDVNHNGRYYYDNSGVRRDIPWRNLNYADSLPNGINSIKRIFWQVTEFDGSMILHYLAGRIPMNMETGHTLPWLYDYVPQYGKIGLDEEVATGIKLGSITAIDENTYKVPVYLNGSVTDMFGLKFDVNAKVVDVSSDVMEHHSDSRVVLTASGEFNDYEPICYLTIRSENPELTFENIRYNDDNKGSFSAGLPNAEVKVESETMLQNVPNPVSSNTMFYADIKVQGNYTLAVYDLIGNKVKTIVSGSLNPNLHSFDWNATDDYGNAVDNGIYVYRLTGDNLSLSKKLIISR